MFRDVPECSMFMVLPTTFTDSLQLQYFSTFGFTTSFSDKLHDSSSSVIWNYQDAERQDIW